EEKPGTERRGERACAARPCGGRERARQQQRVGERDELKAAELLEPEDQPLRQPLLVVPVTAMRDRQEGIGAGDAVQVDVPPRREQPEEVARELAVRVEEPGGRERGEACDERQRPPALANDRRRRVHRLPPERTRRTGVPAPCDDRC